MSSTNTQYVDVVICGSGSAGLCAATLLARAGINCKILEKNSGPMILGQADGVQCRTVEVFESLGLEEQLLRKAYHVLEVAFWSANKEGKLVRTRRTADTMPGLSHQPHVILNQAVVNGILLDDMERNGLKVEYGHVVKSVSVESEIALRAHGFSAASINNVGHDVYPVTVTVEKDGIEEIFKAKYALGCDGAHSSVRRSLGYTMIGDSSDACWGVMDIYPQTNFPDIRKKSTLHSNSGNLLLIPREGNSLVRCYIELQHGTVAKSVTLADLHATAQQIFKPYTLTIAETFWWSAYMIGQRIVNHFHKDNRVFLTGDACHTHSPKAGQGMNVSLQDGYNIGWKLAAVLKGRSSVQLLQTYNLEREKVAADLIDFDRNFTRLFSSATRGAVNGHGPEYFAEQFIKAGKYTAGLTATYDDSIVTCAARSSQELAKGLTVGMRFPSAQVVRFADAKAMQLAKVLLSDGRWRIIVFAGDLRDTKSARRLDKLATFLSSEGGPIRNFTPPSQDLDDFIETILVLNGERVEMEQEQIPEVFCPINGKWRMRDLLKTFVDDESYNSGHGHAYEKYGINVVEGAVVIVRPDQYVSLITALNDYNGIRDFFGGFALRQGEDLLKTDIFESRCLGKAYV